MDKNLWESRDRNPKINFIARFNVIFAFKRLYLIVKRTQIIEVTNNCGIRVKINETKSPKTMRHLC
jgi:hypothetical protein